MRPHFTTRAPGQVDEPGAKEGAVLFINVGGLSGERAQMAQLLEVARRRGLRILLIAAAETKLSAHLVDVAPPQFYVAARKDGRIVAAAG